MKRETDRKKEHAESCAGPGAHREDSTEDGGNSYFRDISAHEKLIRRRREGDKIKIMICCYRNGFIDSSIQKSLETRDKL